MGLSLMLSGSVTKSVESIFRSQLSLTAGRTVDTIILNSLQF